MLKSLKTRDSFIHPAGFTDHHLITVNFVLQPSKKSSAYWHFNIKLLQDIFFFVKNVLCFGRSGMEKRGV